MAQQDKNRVVIEPSPKSPSGGSVIDPTDPQAQKKFQRQETVRKRGGMYSDRVRIDPFKPGYLNRKRAKKTMVKT